jgi:hypothetical protein
MEIGIVRRAFQLAPECSSIDEIAAKLKREDYINIAAHLSGKSIRNDLRKLLKPPQ